MLNLLSNVLITVGAYALTVFLYENLRSPWLLLRAAWREKWKGIKPQSLKERYGEWAAITGASDGIGKEYAKALARKGLNIVLISRSEAKLKTLADEIETESGVRTKILVVDFTHDDSIYEYMSKELDKLPIGILVNNVGANTPRIDYFATFTHKEIADVLHTNIIAVTQLSRYFLQRMKNQKLKGCIINISSLLEMWQVKRGALYAASKAFTRSLTLSLQLEAEPLGITVQLVSPSFVSTKINAYSKFVMRGAWYIPTAEAYAKWAVETIGVSDITTGYHAHGLKAAISKILPWQLRAYIMDFLGRHLVDRK